jgi:hypothetical protein
MKKGRMGRILHNTKTNSNVNIKQVEEQLLIRKETRFKTWLVTHPQT